MNKYTNFRDSEQRLKEMHEGFLSYGFAVDPTPITAGQSVTVLYEGLLAQAGADQVYLHVGYGNNQTWNNVQSIPMYRTDYGWERTFTAQESSRLNFCFKDSANNWDNNNGLNWSYEIHNGERW